MNLTQRTPDWTSNRNLPIEVVHAVDVSEQEQRAETLKKGDNLIIVWTTKSNRNWKTLWTHQIEGFWNILRVRYQNRQILLRKCTSERGRQRTAATFHKQLPTVIYPILFPTVFLVSKKAREPSKCSAIFGCRAILQYWLFLLFCYSLTRRRRNEHRRLQLKLWRPWNVLIQVRYCV